jgi:hypothetical protein
LPSSYSPIVSGMDSSSIVVERSTNGTITTPCSGTPASQRCCRAHGITTVRCMAALCSVQTLERPQQLARKAVRLASARSAESRSG